MPGSFLDSSVLLYFASDDQAKAERAEALIQSGGAASVQVLNEVASVCRRKFRYDWDDTLAAVAVLRSALRVEPLTLETHDLGMRLAQRFRLNVYDGLIVAAALLADCDTLWSEDMHEGLVVGGQLTVRNPFR